MTEDKDKENLNLVVIGHVDSGKSTTCGQLIFHCGNVDKRLFEKFEKESAEMGKASFSLAWFMDGLIEERKRGITINNSLSEMFTPNRKITIIDAPGHRDFIKNMITGATQADFAILIISAAKNEFEAGISDNGQTREHVLLAQTLGVQKIIVAINKMDKTIDEKKGKDFDIERYNEIKNYMLDFFTKLGFKKKALEFLPISGFHGDNVMEKSTRSSWYEGGTLVELIDKIPTPKRHPDKPLRMPISSIYMIGGIGTVLSGKIGRGTMEKGMQVVLNPGNVKGEVKSIEMHHKAVPKAIDGDNVGVNMKGIDRKSVRKGMVISNMKDKPVATAKNFTATIFLHKPMKLTANPVLYAHTCHNSCKILKVKKVIDKHQKQVTIEGLEKIGKGFTAEITFEPINDLVIEPFKECRSLGRFALRENNDFKGCGVVKAVEYK